MENQVSKDFENLIYDLVKQAMIHFDDLDIPHSDFLTKVSVLCFQNLAENK